MSEKKIKKICGIYAQGDCSGEAQAGICFDEQNYS